MKPAPDDAPALRLALRERDQQVAFLAAVVREREARIRELLARLGDKA